MDDTTNKLKSEPLVSIIMLTYNRANYINEAIESVLAQTYQNWELIIIDDGSTDETPSLVAQYQDARIVYEKHEKNEGLHAGRRESLTLANGTYVAVLDSDDMWNSPEKLEKQVTFLENNKDHGVVGTFITIINAQGNETGKLEYDTIDDKIRKSILSSNQFAHSSVLMQKEILDQTKGYQPMLAEDLELFLQIGAISKLANIPEFLTKHRVHKESLNDHGIKMACAVHKIIKAHRKVYPKFIQALIRSYMRLIVGKIKSLF